MQAQSSFLCALVAWLVGVTPVLAEPSLRVRAGTRFDLHGTHAADGFRVAGTLLDDLGAGLPRRELSLRMEPVMPLAASAVSSVTVTTAEDGTFSAVFPVTRGSYRARASYDGDAFHERSDRVELFDLALASVSLELRLPRGPHVQLDKQATRLDIDARSEAGGAGLNVQVSDELTRVIASGVTDADGHLLLQLRSADLGAPGSGTLVASTPGDSARDSARTQLAVLRVLATHVELAARWSATASALDVSGQVHTSQAQLDHKAIGIFVDGEHVATVLSDRRGRFAKRIARAELSAQAIGSRYVQARFQSDAPWLISSASDSVAVELGAIPPRSALWLLVPLLFSLALAFMLARRVLPTSAESEIERVSEPGMHLGTAQRRRPPSLRVIDGRIEDASSGAQLTAASVRLQSTEEAEIAAEMSVDGRFTTHELANGKYLLRATAPGYASVEASIRVPHAGEGSGIRVGLLSLRAVALAAHQPVLQRLVPSADLARTWTARDALSHARAQGHTAQLIEPLTALVEQAAYAQCVPTSQDIDAIEQHARDALRELEAPQAPSPKSQR